MNNQEKILKVLREERKTKTVKQISQEYKIPMRTLFRWYAGGNITLLWQLLLTDGGEK